ncbi:hypothetical protein M758_UG088200 [Ceratodon purpureus]|nr:hypothetical protein M758_UG088200 [Ceratodon purpureus]
MARFGISLSSSSDDEAPPTTHGDTAESAEKRLPAEEHITSVKEGQVILTGTLSQHQPVSHIVDTIDYVVTEVIVLSGRGMATSNGVVSEQVAEVDEEGDSRGGILPPSVTTVISQGEVHGGEEGGSFPDNEMEEEEGDIVLSIIAESNDVLGVEPAEDDDGEENTEGKMEDTSSEERQSFLKPMEKNEKQVDEDDVSLRDDDMDDIAMYEKQSAEKTSPLAFGSGLHIVAQGGDAGSICDSKASGGSPKFPLSVPTAKRTFTPLQKWEYENGFEVDGITDVRQWARDVGLNVGNSGSADHVKRRKIHCAVEAPKYAFNYVLDVLSPEVEADTPSPSQSLCGEVSVFPRVNKGEEKAGSDDDDATNSLMKYGDGTNSYDDSAVSRKGKEKAK